MGTHAHIGSIFAGSTSIDEIVRKGIEFATGRGSKVDYVEAHKWFNIAAAQGDKTAAERREELAAEMSKDEIAEALRAARQWMSSK